MQTLPNATCILHAEGVNDNKHQKKLFANDDGIVRFQVRPSVESDKTARFEVDCAADGKVSIFPLELRPSSAPTADMPIPSAEMAKPSPTISVRPALAETDALHLSSDELARRGYPIRPDEKQAPEAFATWLEAVTKPARQVSSRLVANPDVTHSPRKITGGFGTSSNWSGFEDRGPAFTYDLVMGKWYVPRVYYETNHHDYSAFWIGLDGDGTSDLWQAGTEQDINDITIFGIHFDFTSYYAWSEFLPPQATEQVIANLSVNPGDLMFSEVWVGNAGQGPSLSGLYAIALVENISRSEYTYIYTCRGLSLFGTCFPFAQTGIPGYEAEWIMERPTVNGSLPDLADYKYAYMYDAYAYKTNNSWVTYNGVANEQIFMYNGSDLLSGVYPINNTTMLFYWFGFH